MFYNGGFSYGDELSENIRQRFPHSHTKTCTHTWTMTIFFFNCVFNVSLMFYMKWPIYPKRLFLCTYQSVPPYIYFETEREETYFERQRGKNLHDLLVFLNVSPFKCNSLQTDKWSLTLSPTAHSFQKLLRREGMKRGGRYEARRSREKKGRQKSCINLWRIESDRWEW